MSSISLFTPYTVGSIATTNRIAMAPMTRCRAIGNVPNQLMAEYYGQRSGAGLIITEGTSPSANGLGYARIPGIYTQEQVNGWRLVTDAVHAAGSKIVLQLMHTGRISHPQNMPTGTTIWAPSAVQPAGQMWTDQAQMQDYPTPEAMTPKALADTKAEYIMAAQNAMAAGFDGVELHAANGYLLEQFISPITNIRDDEYGGSVENRCRFVLEVTAAVADAIGKDKTGIRLSPYGVASDMPHYPEIDATYDYLSQQLNMLDIAYIHLVDHSAMGAPEVPITVKQMIRNNFKHTIIACGGYTKATAEADIENGLTDIVAFGRPYINNPDLADRMLHNFPLSSTLLMDLFYSADDKGYTDYPAYTTPIS